MMCRCAWALAVVLGFAATSQAQSDVIKLRLDKMPDLTQGYDEPVDEDLFDVSFRRGFYGYGGYRGYYGHRGYYGGYRGYYRPSFSIGIGIGRPYYGGYYGGYYPRYSYGYSYYRPSYYYSPIYYGGGYSSYYNGGYYSSCYPISLSTGGFSISLGSYPAATVNTEPLPSYLPQPKTIENPAPMLPADQVPNRQPEIRPQENRTPQDRTFPYDGGPSEPVPTPRVEPSNLRPTVPLEGRPVSLPAATAKTTKFAYPAYGEDRAPTKFAEERTVPVQAPGAAARK